MKNFQNVLRESLPEVIGGLVVAAILGLLAVVSGFFDLSAHLGIALRTVIFCLYVILVIAVIYVFRTTRLTLVEPPQPFPRFGKSIRVAAIVVLFAATGGVVELWLATREVVPFNPEHVSILILPFDPMEDCTAKDEDMAKAVYKNLRRQIENENLDNFDVRYETKQLCPANHTESRNSGNLYKADVVVWGEKYERCFPDTSRVCVHYTVVDPNAELGNRQIGDTGIRSVTVDRIVEGDLLDDANYVTDFLIAEYYYEQSNLTEAARYFEKAAGFVRDKRDPATAEVFFCLGDIYTWQSQYDRSIDFYKEAIARNPHFFRAVLNLGIAYGQSGQHENAVECFQRALDTPTTSAGDFNTRGVTYFVLGQYEKALADASKAIELNPKFALAYQNHGAAYGGLGQYEKALADASKAIELNPKLADAYISRGIAYSGFGQYEKALTDYSKAIELNPKLADAYISRGIAYSGFGQYEKALTDYSKAIELNPKFALAYSNRGAAYFNLGRYEKGVADYSKAIELNPKLADAYTNRGVAYGGLGQYEKALADYSKAIELNPSDREKSVLHYNTACVYSKLHDQAKAIQSLEESLRIGFLQYIPVAAVRSDPDLAYIRNDARFEKLLNRYGAK